MLHKNNWPEFGEQSTPASNVQPTVARTEQQWVGKSNLMKSKRKSRIIYLQTSDSHQFRGFHLFSWKNSDDEYVLEIKIQMWSEFQKEKNPKTKLKEKARKQSKSYWVIQLLHETLTFSCSIIFSLFLILEVPGGGKWEDVPGEQILWATAPFPLCLSPAWDTAHHILYCLLWPAEPLRHWRFSQEKQDFFMAACGQARESSSEASTGQVVVDDRAGQGRPGQTAVAGQCGRDLPHQLSSPTKPGGSKQSLVKEGDGNSLAGKHQANARARVRPRWVWDPRCWTGTVRPCILRDQQCRCLGMHNEYYTQ